MPELTERTPTARRPADAARIGELRDALLTRVRAALSTPGAVDLVDYPDHYNVGDAALWLGERAVLDALGVATHSISTRTNYRRERLRGDGPIVLLAGGNLGGLYATHHELKLRVLRDFPGRPVLQLPQSIRYPNEQRRDELRRAVSAHGATTLMLRDHASYELARRDFDCEVVLAPDMAFGLGPLPRGRPSRELVLQVRTDKESAGPFDTTGFATFDWLQAAPHEPVAAYDRLHQLVSRISGRWDRPRTRRLALVVCDAFARANLRRGETMLSRGRHLVTDRLHGHILACLLGIDHVVVNDQYGKIEAMWQTWTHDFRCARFVPGWDDARALLGDGHAPASLWPPA